MFVELFNRSEAKRFRKLEAYPSEHLLRRERWWNLQDLQVLSALRILPRIPLSTVWLLHIHSKSTQIKRWLQRTILQCECKESLTILLGLFSLTHCRGRLFFLLVHQQIGDLATEDQQFCSLMKRDNYPDHMRNFLTTRIAWLPSEIWWAQLDLHWT